MLPEFHQCCVRAWAQGYHCSYFLQNRIACAQQHKRKIAVGFNPPRVHARTDMRAQEQILLVFAGPRRPRLPAPHHVRRVTHPKFSSHTARTHTFATRVDLPMPWYSRVSVTAAACNHHVRLFRQHARHACTSTHRDALLGIKISPKTGQSHLQETG